MKRVRSKAEFWFYIISPCIIGIVFCVIVVLVSWLKFRTNRVWSSVNILAFYPAAIMLLILDVLVKLIFKKSVLYLWLAEVVLIELGILVFIKFVM